MHSSIFIVYFIVLVQYQPTRAAQSYDTQVISFEPNIITPGVFDSNTLRVTRKGRNEYVITGNFSLLINLGEDSMLVGEVFKKSDISKNYVFITKGGGNICNFMKTNTNFYPRLRLFSNLPSPETCPFPKGNYTVKDYTLDDKIIPPTAPAGTYRLKTTISTKNENLFGYTVDVLLTRNS